MRKFFIAGIAFLCLNLFCNPSSFAQQFLTKIDGWNAYVHLPDDYDQNPSKSYPVIVFVPGIGEVGTNASAVIKNGPNHFVEMGNPMVFNVGGQTIKPIVISIQPVSAWPSPDVLNRKLDSIVLRWRVDVNRIHVTGLSMGGWSWENYVDGYNSKYTGRIASMVAMSAPPPDNTIDNMKLFALAGGRWWGFEGTQDYRSMDKIRDVMNGAVPGSARYYQYVGGHGGWNTWYNPDWKDADGESIYTWMLKQTLGGKANQPPVVSAGSNVTVTLPVNSVDLNGSASDPDGSISGYKWTQSSGPNNATIGSPTSIKTNVKNLITGTYIFKLEVTDNQGATASSSVTVIVKDANTPPSANAGSDQTVKLPVSSTTLSGSGTDPLGLLLGFQWTQKSGPSSAVLSTPDAASTSASGLQQGVYVFELKVSNELGLFSIASVKVTVEAAASNSGDCGCDVVLPKMPDGGIYFINGKSITIKPGQKVCITAGNYPYIYLSGLVGTESQPITIINCGGQVVAGSGPGYCYNIIKSRYFHFTGTGDPNIKYGFKSFWNGGRTSAGMSVRDSSSNYEIDHFEAQRAENGFFCVIQPQDCEPGSWSTGWTMKNLSIHDTYVHDTKGEGYYIASTAKTADVKDCSGKTITVEPVMIDGIKMYNNIVDSTGWDGIQVSSAINAEIFDNRVTNYGTANMGSQQAGIILGSKSIGKVYNNFVANGTGQGIVLTGYKTNWVYNNVIVNAGWDGTGVRQDAVAIDDRPMPYDKYVGLKIYIFNNTIVNPGRNPIQLYNSYGTMDKGSLIYNNLLVKPNNSSPYGNKYMGIDGNLSIDSSHNLYLATIEEAKFVNPTALDFHLNSNSSAVDGGLDASSYGIIKDIDGLSRPQGAAFDIGAYEYNFGTPPQNQAPTADAGKDQTIKLPVNKVTLSGSGKDSDGTIKSYSWQKISGPDGFNIKSPDAAQTEVSDLTTGVYVFELSVTDDKGATGKSTVKITVQSENVPPVANAGNDVTITLPVNSANLSGSGTDEDGTVVSYSWSKVSGPAQGTIANPTSANTSVKSLVEGVYTFELKVTDNEGLSSTSKVKVTVNPAPNKPPKANAGADLNITLPTNSITLNGNGTDEDGSVTNFSWTKLSGPSVFKIESPLAASTIVSGLTLGVYYFELKVTDNKGATGSDTVKVTVNQAANIPPTADAGNDQTITLPTNSVSLSGKANDVDGKIVSYLWTKTSGPASFNISDPNNANTQVTALEKGVYVFQLLVKDDNNATATSSIKITVNEAVNISPTANAGADQTITLPVNKVTVNGSGNDPDGTIVSYKWNKISGPSLFTILNADKEITEITGLVQGVYIFELTVMDNRGATATSTLKITVNEAANKTPSANAGPDKIITLPVNSTTLSGAGSDEDGSIVSYKWSKIKGPSSFNIVSSDAAVTDVTNLVEGVYEFQLEVKDNKDAIGADIVKVTVNPAPNKSPKANAGPDRTIILPVNYTSLSGSGTDEDGTISSYLWTKISGPSTFNIVNAASPVTDVTNLTAGIYEFQIKVTDNKGATATSVMKVTVNEPVNVPPSANAGKDQFITLPLNKVTLTGTGKDDDGSIVSYSWKKTSGPSNFSITSPNSANTEVTGLVQGVYTFELTVKDNKGASGASSVKITVNAEPNKAPKANAGPDRVLTLPVNTTSLAGSGTDEDGTIVSYLWTKISGPSGFSIVNAASPVTDVTSLVQGVYEFQLKVTDNKGATATDIMKVTVNPAANKPPVANAGPDIVLTLPANTAKLSGSGSDPDGKIVTYLWTKVSGPVSFNIANNSSPVTDVNGLGLGVYEFQLKVTDDKGATATDVVKVTVNAAPNQAPSANAGLDKTILLPLSSVTLNGFGSDVDGTIEKYYWAQVSGPNQAIIESPGQATTNISGLIAGNYLIELTVMDNSGLFGRDTVIITVEASRTQIHVQDLIRVYPNPTPDVAVMELNGMKANDKLMMVVSDMSGKVIFKKEILVTGSTQKESIDLTRYAKGLYTVTLYANGQVRASKRILKLK